MSVRTDKVSGTITCVFGIVMIGFGSFGLMIVALQRVMISAMPSMPQNANVASLKDAMHAIHNVWFIYLPIMIVGGIIYAISGFHVRRGSLAARRIAQANAIFGYIWVVAYSISCYQVIGIIGPRDILSESASRVFQWFSIIVGTLIGAAFPSGLLYILSRPQHPAAKIPRDPTKDITNPYYAPDPGE